MIKNSHMIKTVVLPILKEKTKNATDKNNYYRPVDRLELYSYS